VAHPLDPNRPVPRPTHSGRFPSDEENRTNTAKESPDSEQTGNPEHLEDLPVSQERDDFEDLTYLLRQSLARADRIRRRSKETRSARSSGEVSQDYAERLAEKAIFRRLLSSEAMDGLRFRWLVKFVKEAAIYGQDWITFSKEFENIDSLRKWIDDSIAKEERASGPTT
jgi:hypothetical protein